MEKIGSYLSTPSPRYALMISGPWGVGKSHYWETVGARYVPRGASCVAISVAGLFSLEELEKALFLASVKLPSQVKEVGRVVGRAAARFLQFDPDDIVLRSDLRAGAHVVVLEDFERFAGEFETLFGFALQLLDSVGIHLILVADEEKAIAKEGLNNPPDPRDSAA